MVYYFVPCTYPFCKVPRSGVAAPSWHNGVRFPGFRLGACVRAIRIGTACASWENHGFVHMYMIYYGSRSPRKASWKWDPGEGREQRDVA